MLDLTLAFTTIHCSISIFGYFSLIVCTISIGWRIRVISFLLVYTSGSSRDPGVRFKAGVHVNLNEM